MKKTLLLLISIPLYFTVHAQYIEINFESADTLLAIDTTSGNIWQIGRPSKIFFDSAYSAPNAIITDTSNYYPINNLSRFTVKVYYNFSGWDLFFDFTHKWNTDSLLDGGYVEVSYNAGATWTNVADDAALQPSLWNWPGSTIANGNKAFTGHGGWQYSSFGWCGPPSVEYILLRFVFSSDGIQTNKEGWMIDNIHIYAALCAGVEENENKAAIDIFPNPAHSEFKISESGELQIFNALGEKVYQQTEIRKNETINCDALKQGIYFVIIKTSESIHQQKLIIN